LTALRVRFILGAATERRGCDPAMALAIRITIMRRLSMLIFRFFGVALLTAVAMTSSGCAEVAPWQRGRLARADMALSPNPAERALREHVYMSREAAMGGATGAGGGCGCY